MAEVKNCCGHSRGGATPLYPMSNSFAPGRRYVDFDTAFIPGGPALLGTKNLMIRDDGESPLRRKKVRPFRMAKTTVTNA